MMGCDTGGAPARPGHRGYRVSDRTASPPTLAFLTIQQEPAGWAGYYLVTNAWGRPLEFRLSSAVQPNRVQTALYGPTLMDYLHGDVIGKALVEKTSLKPDLIVTDGVPGLALRGRVEVPVVALRPDGAILPAEARSLTHPRCSLALLIPAAFATDEAALVEKLDQIDPAVDLVEPFARIREAVAEARKLGVSGRAA